MDNRGLRRRQTLSHNGADLPLKRPRPLPGAQPGRQWIGAQTIRYPRVRKGSRVMKTLTDRHLCARLLEGRRPCNQQKVIVGVAVNIPTGAIINIVDNNNVQHMRCFLGG